jgi:hypothetical protein
MPLWWRKPLNIRVAEFFVLPEKLRIIIDPPNPPDPLVDPPYSHNWGLTYVQLRQGTREKIILARADGRAELSLLGFRSGAATVTIARAGHQPEIRQIRLHKPRKKPGKLLLLGAMILGCFLLERAIKKIAGREERAKVRDAHDRYG